MKDFIEALNKAVKFTGKDNIILKVKKTNKDSNPVVVKLERVFKHGEIKFKQVD